jgi:hypothetical protein
MALIKCNECGSEISDKATTCPKCGNPLHTSTDATTNTEVQEQVEKEVKIPSEEKGTWAKTKLVLGIISILLFFLITLQSCAAGLSNTLSENGSSSGSLGLYLAIFMLIAGIIGIVTRKSSGKGGTIAAIVFYWLGALITVGGADSFSDLIIWGTVSFIFGFVFLGSILVNLSVFNTEKNKKLFKPVFGVIIAIIAILGLVIGTSGNDAEIDNNGIKVTASESESKNEKKEEAKEVKKFGINETVLIETSEGNYKLTITGISETKERNMFSDKDPAKVVIISYDYENIDYSDSVNISDFNFKVYDKGNNSLETYPADTKYSDTISPGRKASASVAYGLDNTENYIEIEFFDNMFSSKSDAIFALVW